MSNETVVAPKKGRKTNAERTSVQDPEFHEAELAREIHLTEVDAAFGDDLPYDRARIEGEARLYLEQGTRAYLEAGRRLILLKEHEGHGNWGKCLERIGLSEDVAVRMMFTVRKLGGTSLSNPVTSRDLTPSKLYELALLEQPELEELDKAGKVGGLRLDEVDRMTTRELREAVRRERARVAEALEASDRLIAAKQKKINEQADQIDSLERQVHLRPEPTASERAEAQLRDVVEAVIVDCMTLVEHIRSMGRHIERYQAVPGLTAEQVCGAMAAMVSRGTEAVITDWEAFTERLGAVGPAGVDHV